MKVRIRITQVADVEIGDVPPSVIQKAIEEDDRQFSIFDFGVDVDIEDVQVETIK